MPPPANTVNRRRLLWLVFGLGFAGSLLGLLVLFNPTLEFYAIDLIEMLHLSIGVFGNIALLAEVGLLLISSIGLVTMTIQHLFRRRVRTSAP